MGMICEKVSKPADVLHHLFYRTLNLLFYLHLLMYITLNKDIIKKIYIINASELMGFLLQEVENTP